MTKDLLEQKITLPEILDQDSLQRVCMTYARMHGTGIAVADDTGQVLVDVPAQLPLCRIISAHKNGPEICNIFDSLMQPDEEGTQFPRIVTCICGLTYQIQPIIHQGNLLGKVVFGPYRTEDLDQLAEDLFQTPQAGDADKDRKVEVAAATALSKMAVMSEERARLALRSLDDVLSVIVQTGYARHLTSQIHIAAIQDAYNELTEKNRRLADSVEKLKELDKLKSNFLATVSHELRTPLTSVIGYSEMLLEGLAGSLTEEQRDYVKIIMEKGDQLLQIINEVLNISKIETGNIQLICERVNLPELLQQVTDAMMPQARRKEIHLGVEAAKELPLIWIDRAKTRQILLNLLSNAIKFTPRGGRVTASAQHLEMSADAGQPQLPSPPAILIRVQDSGIGIPEESVSKVFEAFFQIDSTSTREYGGTGLGLSIVKNFVEAHGGRVWVETGEEAGTIFNVSLPVNPTPAAMGRQSPVRPLSVR